MPITLRVKVQYSTVQYSNSTGRNPSEYNTFSARQQKKSLYLWNPEVHNHVHNSLPVVPILKQTNPVYVLLIHFLISTSIYATIYA